MGQSIKAIISDRTNGNKHYLKKCQEREYSTISVVFQPKMLNSYPNHEETSKEPDLRDILKQKLACNLQKCQAIKSRED